MFQDLSPLPNTPLKPISPIKTMPPVPSAGQPTVPQPPKEPIKKSGNISSAGWAIVIVFILALAGGGGYLGYTKILPMFQPPVNSNMNANQPVEPPPIAETLIEKIGNLTGAPIAMATAFATYDEPAVAASPAVPAYQAVADLNNVENASQFGSLTESAKGLLAKNNFAVVPGYENEFFSLYESNRYGFIPSFITSDSILHNYHLAFDYLLRSMETDKLKAEATALTYGMAKASQDQYEQLKGTAWENAAKRNVAFFSVANKLIYPSAQTPEYVGSEVAAELALIEAHAAIAPSPVINIGNAMPEDLLQEDYSQYIPRGHYTRSDDLKIYFKSMMYLGRLTFRLKSEDETKSAALISLALQTNENLKDSWEKIYEPTAFFVGVADDLTHVDYYKELSAIFGNDFTLTDLTGGEIFKNFIISANNLPAPKINSMPIFDARLQPDRTKEIKGFRFMGQRYTLDADIFQRLIYREVGDKEHACDTDPLTWSALQSRRLPSAVDVAAAFGSTSAADIQDKKGETGYACYAENMNKMRSYVASLDGKTWTQNLYWGWLYFLRPLLAEKPAGYPSFMTNEAWQKKDLNTFLSSWTELKRDTILYAKQVYAEMGAGGPPEKIDDRGYVEPNPYLYARLSALIKMTKEGLQLRSLLNQIQIDLLDRLNTLALRLKDISEKELNNQALTDDDYEFIRGYGGSLEHLWLEANKDLGIESKSQLFEEPAAIVTDVASDPGGQVLEEGTGRIFDIYVVVPIDGKLRIAKGGVFSHYEFSRPIADRLTDEAWRAMLNENKQPEMAEWMGEFIAK